MSVKYSRLLRAGPSCYFCDAFFTQLIHEMFDDLFTTCNVVTILLHGQLLYVMLKTKEELDVYAGVLLKTGPVWVFRMDLKKINLEFNLAI